jgi:hypothetical protein
MLLYALLGLDMILCAMLFSVCCTVRERFDQMETRLATIQALVDQTLEEIKIPPNTSVGKLFGKGEQPRV